MKLYHFMVIKLLFETRIIFRYIVQDVVTGIDSLTCPELHDFMMCVVSRVAPGVVSVQKHGNWHANEITP